MIKRFSKVLVLFCIAALLVASSGCAQGIKIDMGKNKPTPVQSPETKTPETTETNVNKPEPSEVAPTPEPPVTVTPSPSPSTTPDTGLNEKANEDFAKLAPTTVMSFAELVGDNGDYKAVKEYPPAGTYKIVVNVYYQVITVYKKDADGNFTIPVRYMICSSGSYEMPTPTGKFKLGKERHRFSKFVTYNVFGQYWTQITRNIFFHSLLYTQRNAKTYTNSSYRNLGKRASHGCIRLLVPDARWIYYNAAPGTSVEIIRGKKNAKLAEIKKKLTRAKLPSKRPNLKKGQIPVTEPWPGYSGPIAPAKK